VINLYLNGEHEKHREDIETLARTKGAAADAQLQGYAREALRLFQRFGCLATPLTAAQDWTLLSEEPIVSAWPSLSPNGV
jgi:hypothetical protein